MEMPYQITTWLPESDVEWIQSEQARLSKLGWSTEIKKTGEDTKSDKFSLWRVNSKKKLIKENK